MLAWTREIVTRNSKEIWERERERGFIYKQVPSVLKNRASKLNKTTGTYLITYDSLLQDTGTYLYYLCLYMSAYANIDRNTTFQQYLMILTIRENVQWSISEEEEKSK